MNQEKQTVEYLIQQCVLYFEQNSFSKARIDCFKSIWKKGIVPYMAESSILYYDASVGEQYLLTQIGNMVESTQKDNVRSIYFLNDIQITGTVGKLYCNPCRLSFTGQIGQLMEELCRHLKGSTHYKLSCYAYKQ